VPHKLDGLGGVETRAVMWKYVTKDKRNQDSQIKKETRIGRRNMRKDMRQATLYFFSY
jgi:hypothetical protein